MNVKELYHIEKIFETVVVVFCTTYINPISYLSAIEKDLSHLGFSGKIIFDLLLSNGCSPNRFIEVDVNKAKLNRISMKVIGYSSLDKRIIAKIDEFYKSHRYLVDRSNILLNEEKYSLIYS